ncbi:hypothetical protein MNL09_06835 [Bartonella krasnovii]|nr:hypothetical protein MNL09_06835 [Bartonella krasnovii]
MVKNLHANSQKKSLVFFFAAFIINDCDGTEYAFLVRTIIAPGFSEDATKFNATIHFTAIMFPYLTRMSLAAMMGACSMLCGVILLPPLHHSF